MQNEGIGYQQAESQGGKGRQPNASFRSVHPGPLPLVANFVKDLTILDISSTDHRCAAIGHESYIRCDVLGN